MKHQTAETTHGTPKHIFSLCDPTARCRSRCIASHRNSAGAVMADHHSVKRQCAGHMQKKEMDECRQLCM